MIMVNFQPTGIQLHLVTGHKKMFYQERANLVAKICDDLDGRIFTRASLILDGTDDVTAFQGTALLGITILTDPLPESFYQREKLSNVVVTQISQESFQLRRLQYMSNVEGERGPSLSTLEFISGECLFLEFSEIAESGMAQRDSLFHLFTRPTISCRRLEGGFSIWNTAHIVSWSHYPKLEVPANSWQVESLAEPAYGDAKIVNFL